MTTTLHLPHPRLRREPAAAPPAPAPAPDATIVNLFLAAAAARPDAVALQRHDGKAWRPIHWHEYEQAVKETAVGLRSLGLEPGDRVGILSGNRPEWHIADLGILAAGLVSTPVYATSSSGQIAYILANSGTRVCFVDDGQQLSKLLLRRHEVPALERVVVMDGLDGADDDFVGSMEDLRRRGARLLQEDPERFASVASAATPEALATLVYTSGTTGPPKGAMITHANIMATLRSLTSLIDLRPTDRFLSFLPLSHITERCVSHFGQVVSGGETWFARSLTTVPDDLRDCRPTLFFAVPRVWEKFRESILTGATEAPAPLGAVLHRYLELADERGDRTQDWAPTTERATFAALDRSVGALLRHKLGLDEARMLSSGAAPIHPDLLRWFHGIGLPIAEGYGQTEVTLCTTLNPADDIRIGTVGRPIPGVELQIAEDGEILVRAPNVCAGYWKNPKATAELVEPDGWLHTGDLGSIDGDGYLSISGRKKDLIINAYGKNISPSEIETALRQEPLISQAVVIGDGRKFLTALLTLDTVGATAWAAERGHTMLVQAGELIEDPAITAGVEEAVERVNEKHSHTEGIRRWRLLPRDLSVAGGELTPTLKVKREVVTSRYRDLIDQMYAEAEEATP
jgi:long-chain acyl-CoA synthetase